MSFSYDDYCGFFPGYMGDADALGISDLPRDVTNPFFKMSLANLIKAFWSARTVTASGTVTYVQTTNVTSGYGAGDVTRQEEIYAFDTSGVITPPPAGRTYFGSHGGVTDQFAFTFLIPYTLTNNGSVYNASELGLYFNFCFFLNFSAFGSYRFSNYSSLAQDAAGNIYFFLTANFGGNLASSFVDIMPYGLESTTGGRAGLIGPNLASCNTNLDASEAVFAFDLLFTVNGESITVPVYMPPAVNGDGYTTTETVSGSLTIEIDDFYP